MTRCYPIAMIERAACSLLRAAGLAAVMAKVVASTLGEAELIGRDTHGLTLLDWYLADLQTGAMARSGKPALLNDHGAALVWDGNMLPGAWLIHSAMDEAFERLAHHPVVTLVIKRSHHVGCHAVYLARAVQRSMMMLLMDTNPGLKAVAPYGSADAMYSTTPISAGIPTRDQPIIVDFSVSSTSLGKAMAAHHRKQRLPGCWLMDHRGSPTDDPSVLFTEPRGSILPLGGADLGYKGFALATMVYALAAGLSGYTRSDSAGDNDSAVFLQLIDPRGFAGPDAFRAAMSSFAEACRACAPAPGHTGVRMPGEGSAQLRDVAVDQGVALSSSCVEMLTRWSRRLGVVPELS